MHEIQRIYWVAEGLLLTHGGPSSTVLFEMLCLFVCIFNASTHVDIYPLVFGLLPLSTCVWSPLYIYLCLVSSVDLLVFGLLILSTGFWSFPFIYLSLIYSFVYMSLVSSCPLVRFFRLSTCVGLLLLSNLFLVSSQPDYSVEVSIRKVLRPATLKQVSLGFPVSISKC